MRKIEELEDVLRSDAVLASLPQMGSCTALFDLAGTAFLVRTQPELGVQPDVGINDSWDFSFTISEEAWQGFCADTPPPGRNSAQSMVANIGPHIVGGDRRTWAQYATLVERVLQGLRGSREARPSPELPEEGQTVGRYTTIEVDGVKYRTFYETAGEGVPLVCLHTAGSDSRQYRYLLEDPDITSRFQIIAFDMPWHGRSAPAPDWRSTRYELRTEWYAATILAFCDQLNLDAPVLMGCSMGGSIALWMSSKHGDRFGSIVALEGGFGNPKRRVSWTRHSEVDHSLFLTTWVDGLLSPNSPKELQEQILWQYAQSGPGIYNGDTHLFSEPDKWANLPRATCPLYVLCGEYDYSTTPEMARTAAEHLGGTYVLMEGMGHFPMAEDPEGFKRHLMPVLDRIQPVSTGGPGSSSQ